jgi:hypothetical protein
MLRRMSPTNACPSMFSVALVRSDWRAYAWRSLLAG